MDQYELMLKEADFSTEELNSISEPQEALDGPAAIPDGEFDEEDPELGVQPSLGEEPGLESDVDVMGSGTENAITAIKQVEKYYYNFSEQIEDLMLRNGYGKPVAIIPMIDEADPNVYMIVGTNVTITIKGDDVIKEFYTYKV
jgi:hypothetical protein